MMLDTTSPRDFHWALQTTTVALVVAPPTSDASHRKVMLVDWIRAVYIFAKLGGSIKVSASRTLQVSITYQKTRKNGRQCIQSMQGLSLGHGPDIFFDHIGADLIVDTIAQYFMLHIHKFLMTMKYYQL